MFVFDEIYCLSGFENEKIGTLSPFYDKFYKSSIKFLKLKAIKLKKAFEMEPKFHSNFKKPLNFELFPLKNSRFKPINAHSQTPKTCRISHLSSHILNCFLVIRTEIAYNQEERCNKIPLDPFNFPSFFIFFLYPFAFLCRYVRVDRKEELQ